MKNLLLVEIVFSWGHMVRPPFVSGGGSSLPYPPPTTLVGALAYPYAKTRYPVEIIYGREGPASPTVLLLDKVYYAVMGYPVKAAVDIVDMTRQYIYAYLRAEHKRNKALWTAAVGVGKTYSPHRAVIAYVIDEKYSGLLEKLAWGITRIGSKEGIVAVKQVSLIRRPEFIDKRRVRTIFPTPRSIALCEEGCTPIYYWKLTDTVYRPTHAKLSRNLIDHYIVPQETPGVYGGSMKIRVNDNGVILNTPYGPIAIPKTLLTR